MNIDPHKILKNAMTQETPISPRTRAQIVSGASWFGLDTFGDPAVEALIAGALVWLEAVKLDHKPRWLALLGKSGIGKTAIAKRIWKSMVNNRKTETPECAFSPRMIYWPDLVKRLRTGEGMEMTLDFENWPFLILDDICAERDSTGFASEQLNTILGRRAGKWTIITSNKFLSQLADMELRIADRMQRDGSIVVESTAKSHASR